ncbi:hypothetical protein [uncultured Nostoc sp.]|uniref:hypothetical protein n=1 Tax=uncultured Nostoc sp. TaxID=340711 RepID=UPI0035CBD20A
MNTTTSNNLFDRRPSRRGKNQQSRDRIEYRNSTHLHCSSPNNIPAIPAETSPP